jgi:lauroyl/myristoyl acyltransferase
VIQRARARFLHRLSLEVGRLAFVSPAAALFVADCIGALWRIASSEPSRAEVEAIFPDRSAREISSFLRRIWKSRARTLATAGWLERGGRAALHALVRRNEAVMRLPKPVIFGTFHVGPIAAIGAIEDLFPENVLLLRSSEPTARSRTPNIHVVSGTDQQRAAVFHRAVERLRGGAAVVTALDPEHAKRIAVPFFGRSLQLARGPFAMARIAGVPIAPIVPRWFGNEIELIVGEPIAASDDEQQIAAAAAHWLEKYLREHPAELSQRIVHLMQPQS